MAERSLIFPAAEYRARMNRLQGEMARGGLGALLLTTPPDVFWTTGFLTRFWESPARPWFVLVPATGDPIAVIPSIGLELMRRTWITDIRTWEAPNPEDDGVSLLADTLEEILGTYEPLGVPMGLETHLRMPLGDWERLKSELHPRLMADGTDTIHRAREIKSEAEIDKIRTTCSIAACAFAKVPEFARGGRPLNAIFSTFQCALLEDGADWVSYVAGGAGQGGYGDVISPAGPEVLVKGDILMLDTGAVKDGYFCDYDRNFAVGPIAPETDRAHKALWEVSEHVIETIRPGMEACDVHAMMTEGLGARGVTAGGGRLGHGLGVNLTEWPSFTPLDHTELRTSMVLTLEPGAVVSHGKTLVHEENIVLRQTGAELLSPRAPYEMVTLG